MAEVFALQRIQADILFRNDDYVAAEKVKAIGRLLERLRAEMRAQVPPSFYAIFLNVECGADSDDQSCM